ncbi:MAG: magnesium transporter [Rhodospirillales bacterium]
MTGNLDAATARLERRFLLDFPWEAARRIETLPTAETAPTLVRQPAEVLAPLWRMLLPETAARLLKRLPDDLACALLGELRPGEALRVFNALKPADREHYMAALDPAIADDLKRLGDFPEGSAGRLMITDIAQFRAGMTAKQALAALRRARAKTTRSLFLVDEDNRLAGKVGIQDLAVADPDTKLADIATPVSAYVSPLTSQDEVADLLEQHRLVDLPVVDHDGRLLGVVQHTTLIGALQADASVDIQTMVGASKDERALSKPLFAVRKRLPWLQINLLTAFMAAAVVGLFEGTIAKFTALAVLLPVVAGQSGNAGAQALAVTMRGLALREITPRQWFAVTFKEANVGLVNGIAVAATCGIGVYFWSGSLGLVLVITVSMVLAMVAAGLAGAIVPVVLTKLGQDPAVASSIILTTVTDIAGFFSFLGIATILSGIL